MDSCCNFEFIEDFFSSLRLCVFFLYCFHMKVFWSEVNGMDWFVSEWWVLAVEMRDGWREGGMEGGREGWREVGREGGWCLWLRLSVCNLFFSVESLQQFNEWILTCIHWYLYVFSSIDRCLLLFFIPLFCHLNVSSSSFSSYTTTTSSSSSFSFSSSSVHLSSLRYYALPAISRRDEAFNPLSLRPWFINHQQLPAFWGGGEPAPDHNPAACVFWRAGVSGMR